MPDRHRRLLFLLFFLSGSCGLLYQVVWVRMSFASFGVITPVLSVVISVFMVGLFAGSWLAGKAIGPLTARTRISAVWYYALAEIMIGVGAFAVPHLLRLGESWLLPAGESDSLGYLSWSALIIAGAILPWCLFMGATFPLMMGFVKEQDQGASTSFSFLYLANVIGAMAGTLVTALVLVELLGFSNTLLVAAGVNLFIAVSAALLGLKHPLPPQSARVRPDAGPRSGAAPLPHREARLLALILFSTGLTSMAMEVVWTRAFTAVLETQVYSFAALLFTYLLATWIGSLWYRRHLAKERVLPTAQLIAWLTMSATLPIVMNDPRLHLQFAGIFLSISPFCALLGYLTPKLIDAYSAGRPDAAGFSYALNVLGCILGPLFASYLLLPLLGVKYSLLLLAVPYALLLAVYLPELPRSTGRKQVYATMGLFLVAVLVNKTYEDQVEGFHGGNGVVRRDHTATVISYGEGLNKRLLVNGIGITHLTTITKVMAHLPLSLVKPGPRSALVICFGMGTTFRSLMSWDIDATAVELVPSVKDSFPFYFADAKELMSRPNGRIVIDDGRRFLQRTSERFDVITLDPPPPVEAAASSLLYSEEFYSAAKSRLKPGGIVQQWIPSCETRIAQAAARSLMDSFPHVRMYQSFEGWGYHFLASMQPIEVPRAQVLAARLPAKARADLVEWTEVKDAGHLLKLVLEREIDPQAFTKDGEARVTDDRPFNEYYLLRRTFTAAKKLASSAHADSGPSPKGRTAD